MGKDFLGIIPIILLSPTIYFIQSDHLIWTFSNCITDHFPLILQDYTLRNWTIYHFTSSGTEDKKKVLYTYKVILGYSIIESSLPLFKANIVIEWLYWNISTYNNKHNRYCLIFKICSFKDPGDSKHSGSFPFEKSFSIKWNANFLF